MTGTGVTAMAQPRAERALPLPVMQRGVQRSEPRVSGQKSGVGGDSRLQERVCKLEDPRSVPQNPHKKNQA